ncbi:hypothetical protein B296_00053243 [Ensete ventricosum]|uniref:Uncharacterized protein n=1 Tax=Ensete ventricosum TaxID=4639 RepID=A0A426XX92_ENSVE|nr:hypothetical protein B296_00053243 [Ensete ventricosum]
MKKVAGQKLAVLHQPHLLGSHDAIGLDGGDLIEEEVVHPPKPSSNPAPSLLEITTPFAFNRRDPPVEMSTESSIGSSFPRINSTPRHDDHRGDVDDEKKRPADHDSGPGVEGVQPHSQVHCIHQHLCLHGSRLQMDENQFSTGHFLDL